MRKLFFLVMAMVPVFLWAQFAPAQDKPGTTAMYADSSAFVGWATGVEVVHGPMNIADPDMGVTGANYPDENALGYPEGTFGVVCLGDGGMATLTFASPIYNGEGPDFAVFENGFANAVNPDTWALELAFVEVSSDGEHFFRFPAYSNTQATTQLANGGTILPSEIHNLASKYGAMYGTPFDLDEVEDDPLLDKNRVTHVRVVDVVGCIDPQYATYDCQGHIINDPWPTPFASSGFDLDAVGVIHDLDHYDVAENGTETIALYPNPVRNQLIVKAENLQSVEIYNLVGQRVMACTTSTVDMGGMEQGIYFVRVVADGKTITNRVVKQ